MQNHNLVLTAFLMGFVIAWAIYSVLFQYAEKRMGTTIDILIETINEMEEANVNYKATRREIQSENENHTPH